MASFPGCQDSGGGSDRLSNRILKASFSPAGQVLALWGRPETLRDNAGVSSVSGSGLL